MNSIANKEDFRNRVENVCCRLIIRTYHLIITIIIDQNILIRANYHSPIPSKTAQLNTKNIKTNPGRKSRNLAEHDSIKYLPFNYSETVESVQRLIIFLQSFAGLDFPSLHNMNRR